MTSSVRLGGVDGCPGGWVLATTGSRRGTATSIAVVGSFAEIVAMVDRGQLAEVGVDMPIGLPPSGSRACDVEARRRLGARRSSVFPTPPRPLLSARRSYAEALARSRSIDGKGLSKQAFHLLPKIAEVDAAVEPTHQPRVFECHPESCFVTLAGTPLRSTKRTPEGLAERCALLRPHVPDVDDLVVRRPRGARADDVVDALAVACAARRHRRSQAVVLGDGARDERGLRMEIVA